MPALFVLMILWVLGSVAWSLPGPSLTGLAVIVSGWPAYCYSGGGLIRLETLKPGAIVCDVGVPHDTSRRDAALALGPQAGVATRFRRRLSCMEKLKKDVTLIAATLEALAANVKANTEDQKRMAEEQKRMAEHQMRMAEDQKRMAVTLEGMGARGKLMDEDLQSLRGTFASIGEHLIRLFERDAEMRAWRETMEARVEALEKRQPPAA